MVSGRHKGQDIYDAVPIFITASKRYRQDRRVAPLRDVLMESSSRSTVDGENNQKIAMTSRAAT